MGDWPMLADVVIYRADKEVQAVVREPTWFADFRKTEGFRFDATLNGDYTVGIFKHGDTVRIEIQPQKKYWSRIKEAYQELKQEVFGFHDESDIVVYKETYTTALRRVEQKYSIDQGDPDFGEWTMTLIMRSPKFYPEPEGEKTDG